VKCCSLHLSSWHIRVLISVKAGPAYAPHNMVMPKIQSQNTSASSPGQGKESSFQFAADGVQRIQEDHALSLLSKQAHVTFRLPVRAGYCTERLSKWRQHDGHHSSRILHQRSISWATHRRKLDAAHPDFPILTSSYSRSGSVYSTRASCTLSPHASRAATPRCGLEARLKARMANASFFKPGIGTYMASWTCCAAYK
jgi:hypothetical protein